MDYDEVYRRNDGYFGEEPEAFFLEHINRLDREHPVLDVDTGQGRHTLALAQLGFSVEAIDPSSQAVEIVRTLAQKAGLTVYAEAASFQEYTPRAQPFGGILLFGLIQILTWDEIDTLCTCIDRWTQPGSLLFITAFLTDDPSHARLSATMAPSGKNSYWPPGGERRTFLEPGEVLELFPNWQPVHHWEGMGPEHRHGPDGPWHHHARIEAVLQRVM